jgi:hypothetical protein
MYLLLKTLLAKATRPILRVCGEDGSGWDIFEPGAMTETLGRWREETLQAIGCAWLGNWEDQAA